MMSAIFEEENPGWSVEHESSTFDQIDQKAILDFEAGVSHDVLLSSPQLMAKHEAAGDLIDLTPYLEETYTPEQLADLNWSAGWKSATFGDQQLGIATGIHVRGNMVRNDSLRGGRPRPVRAADDARGSDGGGCRDQGVRGRRLGPRRLSREQPGNHRGHLRTTRVGLRR